MAKLQLNTNIDMQFLRHQLNSMGTQPVDMAQACGCAQQFMIKENQP
jgi:hypothetical protein